MSQASRREFLADVGRGMLVASVGAAVAADMGFAPVCAADAPDALTFGPLEPLVALMQETAPDKLLPQLVERLKSGTDLKTLVAAAALANARTFGGEDYIGYHTFMALAPAYEMSKELPEALRPLPVLKVLHRNAGRIQAFGGKAKEVLHPVEAIAIPADRVAGEVLQETTRKADMKAAEGAFASLASGTPGEAYQHLQMAVQDEVDVHRIVLCWRAWATRELTGEEYAHTLLRQSVRYCVDIHFKWGGMKRSPIQTLLPTLFDQYKLLAKPLGTREADDSWIDEFSRTVCFGSQSRAAEAAAAALAEGISPESVGEAIALAANRLLLHDPGRQRSNNAEKPIGSVHGDSVGVHASDSANAWRNIARVSNPRNTAASMIVGAYHTAGQSGSVNKEPYPTEEQLAQVKVSDPSALLVELDAAIRNKDQFRATAVATQYARSGGDARPIFDVLLRYGTSEDGALHAEKYYRTVSEEFAKTRPAFRWRQIAALARVTTSEYGKTAPGYTQAKELLKIS